MFAAPAPLPAPPLRVHCVDAAFHLCILQKRSCTTPDTGAATTSATMAVPGAPIGGCWRAGHGGIERSPAPLEHGGAGEATSSGWCRHITLGSSGNKSVRHLLAEINATESSLRQRASGTELELVRELTRRHRAIPARARTRGDARPDRRPHPPALQTPLSAPARGRGVDGLGAAHAQVDPPRSRRRAECVHAAGGHARRADRVRPAHSFPSLATECTRHFVSVVLDEHSNTENLGIAVQDRFNTAEFPS